MFDSPLPHVSAGLQQQQEVATEALQLSTLLLPPPNRRRLQLLLRLMARVCQNPHLPPLNDAIATRTLVHVSKVLTFCFCDFSRTQRNKHFKSSLPFIKLCIEEVLFAIVVVYLYLIKKTLSKTLTQYGRGARTHTF